MQNYQAVNDWETISLHDCRITRIQEESHKIICTFADGYWIIETNSQNLYKKTLGTSDNAQLILCNTSHTTVLINDIVTVWEDFCSNINTNKWEFEIITESYTDESCSYIGWVWFGDEPYHCDCQLNFACEKILYQWNEICENRTW